jgi:hypothetical protein
VEAIHVRSGVADRNVIPPSDTSAVAWLSQFHPTCQRKSLPTFPLQSSAGFLMQTQSLSTLLSPGPGLQTSTNQSERQRSAAAYASVFFDRSTRSQQLIHERIQSDLPSFNSQLAAAESIRSRLHALQDNTEQLSDAISNPEVCPPSSF